VFRRELVERREFLLVLDDLRHRLGELRAVRLRERLDRVLGVFLVLGAPDLGEGGLGRRLRGLRKRVQDVRGFMKL
jgi:hypothetical protein